MSSEISINERKITKCFVFPKNPYRIATSTLLALSSLFNLLDPEHCFFKIIIIIITRMFVCIGCMSIAEELLSVDNERARAAGHRSPDLGHADQHHS